MCMHIDPLACERDMSEIYLVSGIYERDMSETSREPTLAFDSGGWWRRLDDRPVPFAPAARQGTLHTGICVHWHVQLPTLPLYTQGHTASFVYGHRAGAGTTAISTGTTTTTRTTHCATCAPMMPSRGRIGRWSATRTAGALRAHARALTEPKPKPNSESGSGPDLTPTLGSYSLAGASRLLAIHHYNMRHAEHYLMPYCDA